jgi:hypothetical protein
MALVMGIVPTLFLRQIDQAVKTALVPMATTTNAAAPAAHHLLQVLAQVIGR